MAHVLTIIPDGYRASKRVQILSCMKNKTGKIQQKLDCAAKGLKLIFLNLKTN